jgi:hypothetical protein
MIELLATLEPPDPEPPAPGRTVHILFVGVGFTTVAYASYGDFRRDGGEPFASIAEVGGPMKMVRALEQEPDQG